MIRVQPEPFDLGEESDRFLAALAGAGGTDPGAFAGDEAASRPSGAGCPDPSGGAAGCSGAEEAEGFAPEPMGDPTRAPSAETRMGRETTFAAAPAVASPATDPAGAVVTFTGIVRDLPGGGLVAMEIEHYPGMTERAIGVICDQARARWTLSGVHVIHRIGRLAPGEVIMMVATASPHRAEAFAAAEFLMDYLKSRAPFWKREITADGAEWVAAKDSDEDALKRW